MFVIRPRHTNVRGRTQRLGWVLLALVLAMRLALPAGWMPVASADGVRIEICSGAGTRWVVLDAEGKAHPDQPQPKANPCPFGLAGSAPFALPAVTELAPPAVASAPRNLPPLLAARLVAWRAIRPPARGPPALA